MNTTTANDIKTIIRNATDSFETRCILKLCLSSVQPLLTELQAEIDRLKPNYIELGKKADKLHSTTFSICSAIRLATSITKLQDLVIEQSTTPRGATLHPSDDDSPFPA